MSAEILQQIQERINRSCPYNSASALIEFHSGTFRMEMGGSCAQQLRIAQNYLREQGLDLQYIRAEKSVHHAGVVNIDGEIFFFDPSKTMKEAISLRKLFRDRTALIAPAFPNNERARRSVRLVPTSESMFREEILTASKRTQWQDDVKYETFSMGNILDQPPLGEIDCRTSVQGRSIQMVAVLPDGDVATLKASDTSRINIRLLAGEEETDPDRKKTIFTAIAQTCGVTRNELFRYLYQGQQLLQEMLKEASQN